MLLKRIITAIVLSLAILGGIIYLPPIGFALFTLLITLLAAWEFSAFFSTNKYLVRVGFLLVLILTAWLTKFVTILVLLLGVLWWLIAPIFLWRYSATKKNYFGSTVSQFLLGLVLFIPCWFGMIVIYTTLGAAGIIYLLAIVSATDVGAYFSGRFFGKRPLAPAISPKKTIEGVWGGILFSLLIAIGTLSWLHTGGLSISGLNSISFVLLTLITCLWSVIGDLFESMLKRVAGVKDSGALLPGHGGIYDRIDSLTSAVPIFAVGLSLINW